MICYDWNIEYDSMETIRKLSSFLKELLMDTCCRAVIILADSNTSDWYSQYVNVNSDLVGLVTNHLVDPKTGFIEVSNIL